MGQDRDESTVTFESGSGNVFADLGLPHPEEALAKAQLAEAVADAIAQRGLSQVEAGKLLGIGQPKVSQVVNGNLSGLDNEES
jgi:predicted XRE-type DNA-binding protein